MWDQERSLLVPSVSPGVFSWLPGLLSIALQVDQLFGFCLCICAPLTLFCLCINFPWRTVPQDHL